MVMANRNQSLLMYSANQLAGLTMCKKSLLETQTSFSEYSGFHYVTNIFLVGDKKCYFEAW